MILAFETLLCLDAVDFAGLFFSFAATLLVTFNIGDFLAFAGGDFLALALDTLLCFDAADFVGLCVTFGLPRGFLSFAGDFLALACDALLCLDATDFVGLCVIFGLPRGFLSFDGDFLAFFGDFWVLATAFLFVAGDAFLCLLCFDVVDLVGLFFSFAALLLLTFNVGDFLAFVGDFGVSSMISEWKRFGFLGFLGDFLGFINDSLALTAAFLGLGILIVEIIPISSR